MKFRYLYLQAFGHFTDERIDFVDSASFHMIYGPNEAGKSTILRALTDVLYGIPNNTKDGFFHQDRNLWLGAGLINSTQRELYFKRRKGRLRTLLSIDDQELEEAELKGFLGEVDKETFLNMFGLNHQRLREGGRSLLESGGSLGESLFEAASGISNLRKIIANLQDEAGIYFKKNAPTRSINLLTKEYKEKTLKASELSLSVNLWDELKEAYEKKKEQVESISLEIQQNQIKLNKLERIKNTLPIISSIKEIEKEIFKLQDIPVFEEEEKAMRTKAEQNIKLALDGRHKAAQEIKELEYKKNQFTIPLELLEERLSILSLVERLDKYKDSLADLPVIKAEVFNLEKSVNSLLMQLYPDNEGIDNIEKYRPSVTDLATIKSLVNSHNLLKQQRDTASKGVQEKKLALEENESQLKALGDIEEPIELRRILRDIRDRGNPLSELENHKKRYQELKEELIVLVEQLNPKFARDSFDDLLKDLEVLQVPLVETIEQFLDKEISLEGELQKLEKIQKELDKSLLESSFRVKELKVRGIIPSESELLEIRDQRDKMWKLYLDALINPKLEGNDEDIDNSVLPKPFDYEKLITKADKTADIMRHNSDQVAQLTQLELIIENTEIQIRSIESEKEILFEQLKTLNNSWMQIWQNIQLTPLSPKEMLGWRKHFENIIDHLKEYRRLRRCITDLEEEIQNYESVLIDLVGASSENSLTSVENCKMPLGRLKSLIDNAESLSFNINTELGMVKSLKNDNLRLKRQLNEAEVHLKQQESDYTLWQDKWKEILTVFQLPINTTTEIASEFLEHLSHLFYDYQTLLAKRERLKNLNNEIERFTYDVDNLLLKVGYTKKEKNYAMIVTELNEQYQQAAEDNATLRELNEQLKKQTSILKDSDEIIDKENKFLEKLMQTKGASSLGELVEIEAKAFLRRDLSISLQQKRESLLSIGDGLTLLELMEEAIDVDPDNLQAIIGEYRNDNERLNKERSLLEQEFGALKKEYEIKVTGASTVALNEREEAEQVLSKIEREALYYVQHHLAAYLMKKAIEKYSEENQNPIVKRAGEIFAELTLNSFSGLKVDYDTKDNAILVGVRKDLETVDVFGMSDGTQDQLFLALRLASIEQYLVDSEPLPLIVDDILINFDEKRSAQTLKVLAQLSTQTQIIFFTHNKTLVSLAKTFVPENILAVYGSV